MENGDGPIGRLRLTGRATAAFLLDVVAITRGDADLLDALLAAAIIQANTAEIRGHADLQVAFAATDELPPDDMRRPISISAVAASLNVPFETTRRRIHAMAAVGFCDIVEGGVVVPSRTLGEPRYAVDAFRGYERLRAFYYELADLGLLPELPPPSVGLAPGVVPIRAVSRVVGAFVLRCVEALSLVGDLFDGVIVLEVFRSNVETWPADLRGGEGFAAQDMVADRLRRPITVTALARRLALPRETVRRHADALRARGILQPALARQGRGLIVPSQALARPPVLSGLTAASGNLNRMFATLSQLGVLRIWDEVRESHPPALAVG